MRKTALYVSLVLLFLVAAVEQVVAVDLENYRSRLETARLDVISIRRYEDDNTKFATAIAQKVNDLITAIPEHEQVATRTGDVEVDNTWLHDALESYRSSSQPEERMATLFDIEERLAALEAATQPVSNVSGAPSKDDDKRKLGEILRRSEYQKPEAEQQGLFVRWFDALIKWLEEAFPTTSISPGDSPFMGSIKIILQIAIFGIAIVLIAFLIYKFASVIRGVGGSKSIRSERVVLGEIIAAGDGPATLLSEADLLAERGEFRAAIRKGYIALLCELGDRGAIRLAAAKTNRDYLHDLRRRENTYRELFRLTFDYESNWYGLGHPTMTDWNRFRDAYRSAVEQIRGKV